AREMEHRIVKILRDYNIPVYERLWVSTFHSLCSRILREHIHLLEYDRSFAIYDSADQLSMVKKVCFALNLDEKAHPAKAFAARINSAKTEGMSFEDVRKLRNALDEKTLQVFEKYELEMKRANALDFGDLLLKVVELFRNYPAILEIYQTRLKFLMVDEYQDTNRVQYLLVKMMAEKHRNLCVVGDEDQSIYSWRGAEVGNILRFERDYPDATVVRLECNYRSTPHILAAASALIANNQGRLGKTLWTPVKEGDKLRLKAVWDEAEEARFVADEVEALQRKGTSLQDMAILVRAGFQTRSFEERFLTMGISYRVVGGLRFYERAEIRDAIAYLRLLFSPQDDLAFERIINTPKRGIGQATLQQLHSAARNLNGSLYHATMHLLASGELKGKLGATLKTFIEQYERWRAQLGQVPLADLVERILDESGYREMWKKEKSPDAAGRLENLKELARAIGEFETLADFLEHVSLVTENTNNNNNTEMVSLMTLHAAKGLEFDAVFLPGWEEGVFPHQRAIDESGMKGLEEERRLAYVGITRARKTLYISHAANRRIYNQWQNSIPSRFISEIPLEHMEKLPGGMYGAYKPTASQWENEVASILATSTAVEESALFSVGTRVFHQKFGYGRIRSVQGDHLDVEFEKAGSKKVLSGYVEAV
ncbi:MAG: 3'-5' exonuclease, partial [Rickettsiales bacterium]|nr:3'-5' exonuclease [Rickettsiales bacterium]